jgi:hypothetical protein
MLENDLRDMFAWEATADQPPAQISFPAAPLRAQRRRHWRRAAKIGAPIVAAVAAVAIGLAASLASGIAHPSPPPASPPVQVAPHRFNPLVQYATIGWYPYRVRNSGVNSWPAALQLYATNRTPAREPTGWRGWPGPWTDVVVYAAHQCDLSGNHLSCGSAAAGTSGLATLSGTAPDVGHHAAYWVQAVTGDLPATEGRHSAVAFQYARGGWVLAATTGTPRDVIRVAASVRYAQSVPLRFPVQLVDLPTAWRQVRQVDQGRLEVEWLLLGRRSGAARGSYNSAPVPDSLTVSIDLGNWPGLACTGIGNCSSRVINGYRAYVLTHPASAAYGLASQELLVPLADGLDLKVYATGPHFPMSPVDLFAHHLRLLGPNRANWTTDPLG